MGWYRAPKRFSPPITADSSSPEKDPPGLDRVQDLHPFDSGHWGCASPFESEVSSDGGNRKARNSTEPTEGKVKEAAAKVTNNDKLRTEGKSQMNDNLKQAGYTR